MRRRNSALETVSTRRMALSNFSYSGFAFALEFMRQ
jgi:hypothetical protein